MLVEDLLPPGGVVRVLTLWPEWVWAFLHLGKRTENRGWSPPEELLRRGLLLAIHGGAHLGGRAGAPAAAEADEAVRSMFRRGPLPPDGWASPEVSLGAYTGKIAAVGVVRSWDRRDDRSRWDVPGAVHWRLPRVYALTTPIACKGAQGLWTPDDELGNRLLLSRVREAEQPFPVRSADVPATSEPTAFRPPAAGARSIGHVSGHAGGRRTGERVWACHVCGAPTVAICDDCDRPACPAHVVHHEDRTRDHPWGWDTCSACGRPT